MLGERDGCEQRPSPGAEILGSEIGPEVELDVVVEPPAREVVDLALPLVAEDASSAREGQELAHRCRELVVHELGSDLNRVLPAKSEPDAPAADLDVAAAQRRNAVGPGLLRVSLRPDAEPAEIDQPQCKRGNA